MTNVSGHRPDLTSNVAVAKVHEELVQISVRGELRGELRGEGNNVAGTHTQGLAPGQSVYGPSTGSATRIRPFSMRTGK